MRRTSFLPLMLLASLLLLAACGGSIGSEDGPESELGERLDSGSRPREESEAEGPADRGAAGMTSDAAAVCLSPNEAELGRLVNEYRESKGLVALPVTKSLTIAAQQHVWDSNNNSDNYPAPPAGESCNLHSWSANVNPALQEATWTATCFTGPPNWNGIEGSWSKPRELAGYPGDGFENSHWASAGASPSGALTSWQNSPGHNALITQSGGWGPMLAIGVGISGSYAHLWFGAVTDPAGVAPPCGGGGASATATATAVPPTNTATAVPPTNTATVAPTTEPPTNTPAASPTTAASATIEATATTAPATATTAPATATTAPATATTAPATATTAPATATTVPATPTAEPTSSGGATGQILNATGTVPSGGSTQHTFNVANGQGYTISVNPASDFDSAPSYDCALANGSMSGSFDTGFDGEPDSTSVDIRFGDGTCTVTVEGFAGSSGDYTIVVTSP